MNKILAQAKRLHDLGLAIIRLHPKSKRPIENGWTTGPRQSWRALAADYNIGENIGVRLGEPSKIGEHYLTCVDVDIKSPEFKEAALACLKELVGDRRLPAVVSGAGNGSRHLYCLTPEPFKMITVAKEENWEVCIYSRGRQMVLPPSIHPVSGKEYKWAVPLTSIADLPVLDFSHLRTEKDSHPNDTMSRKATKKAPPLDFNFLVEEVELDWLPISEKMLDQIKNGTDVTDKSGFLMPACRALLSAGLNQTQVLSVLTDPTIVMGCVGYDHAKTRSRKAAAAWVYRYTFLKIEKESSPKGVFDNLAVAESAELSDEEIAENCEELFSKNPGFYKKGPKGGMTPLYCKLLEHFNETSPFKTIADMKSVYVFNGTHYENVTPIQIKGFAEDNFRPAPDEEIRREFLNKVLANNIATRAFFTGTTENRINFKNGVLDLETEVVSPHSAEFGFRGVLPYDYDPKARCPFFSKWLLGVMMGDRNLVKIIQEFMGYIVRGGPYKYHKALWLGGVGRNGKSTLVDLSKELIGAGNYSTISIKSLVGDRFVGSDLDGKIANFSEETSPQELADSGPFKNLTGDGDISAQKKYGDPFHFRNRAKLIMTYNQIPDLKDLSAGMLSRPIIIPFKKIIKEGEQDKDIKAKLIAELSGIFNFAMEGWRRLERQNGFTRSDASDAALSTIRKESCNVFQWVETYVDFEEPSEKSRQYKTREVYSAYRARERFAYKASEFFKRLNRHPEIKKRRKHTNKGSAYFGFEMA